MEATETQETVLPARGQSWWRSVREAVSGTQQDYTEGPLGRAVFLLAVPMVLEMAMESLFGILDVFWVGRLGPGAVAVVGVTEALLTLIFAVALGLSLSTTAIVARRIGEKDPEAAAVTAVQAIVLGLLVALPTGLVGLLWPRELLT